MNPKLGAWPSEKVINHVNSGQGISHRASFLPGDLSIPEY